MRNWLAAHLRRLSERLEPAPALSPTPPRPDLELRPLPAPPSARPAAALARPARRATTPRLPPPWVVDGHPFPRPVAPAPAPNLGAAANPSRAVFHQVGATPAYTAFP